VGSGSYNGIVQPGDNAIIYSNGAQGGGGLDIAPWYNGISGLHMNGSGNVGIGIASPTAPLTVYNATASGGAPAMSGSADANMISRAMLGSISVDTGVMANGTAWVQNRILNNFAANYPLVLNPNGGNIGVGMTNPSATLDVNGGIRGNNSSVVVNGTCSPEGMLGYDLTNHEPVYCNSNGKWAASSGSAFGGIYWCDEYGCTPPVGRGMPGGCLTNNPYTGGCSCPSWAPTASQSGPCIMNPGSQCFNMFVCTP
jgi:hypothetical protein